MSLPKLESPRNVTSKVISNRIKQRNQNPQNNTIAGYDCKLFALTAHVTRWSNYLTQRTEILTQRSNLTPQRAKNTGVDKTFPFFWTPFWTPQFFDCEKKNLSYTQRVCYIPLFLSRFRFLRFIVQLERRRSPPRPPSNSKETKLPKEAVVCSTRIIFIFFLLKKLRGPEGGGGGAVQKSGPGFVYIRRIL